MFELEWTINGRKVRPDRNADELGDALKAEAMNRITDAIGRVRCPVHGRGAANVRTVAVGDDMEFKFEACCDRLKQAIAGQMR